MIHKVQNIARSLRIFYDINGTEVKVPPGMIKYAELDEGTLSKLRARNDLIIQPAILNKQVPRPAPPKPEPAPDPRRPAVNLTGHFGIGDNLHQRAVVRELMKDYDVWLHTCHFNLFHDLIARGLKLIMRPTSLHAQAKTMKREHSQFVGAAFPSPPADARPLRIGYPKSLIDRHGSILEAMFGCVGMKMPERPDFSLPLKPEWRTEVRERYLNKWATEKPLFNERRLMIHRPITVRNEWDGRSRNPDIKAYDELYRSIRDQFFVVSIADLAPGREWIEGPEQDVDIKLHNGELTFEEMASLFAAADLIYCNAGFAPVLAQAVGTPLAVVYGGRESYRTTQRVGAHLAPTLPIDVINPCDCHSAKHRCDKRIDLPVALARLQAFTATTHRNILLFGTFYVDSVDREALTELWITLHTALNDANCDFLVVDSQSPIKKFQDWHPYDGKRHRRMYYNFPDNIGHLSRPLVTPGRDGWGRAFCKGIEIAIALGYEYVVHIEGDSLCRLKVADVVRQMQEEGIECTSSYVRGMRNKDMETEWVETGLMFFATDYLKRCDFIARYDWAHRQVSPSPERFIMQQILRRDLDYKRMRLEGIKALRADKNQINKGNIETLNLDWVTHQHNSAQQEVYSRFVDMALGGSAPKEVMPADQVINSNARPVELPQSSQGKKLNLGCGTNKIPGWENYDADVDITKPLPWPDSSAAYIVIEHCVEHVPYKAAIEFFKEAHRVLMPGGVLRVTVPSLEQIAASNDADYLKFTQKWQPLGPTKRGAAHAIIYAHGHEVAWNAQLMRDTLWFAGFDDVRKEDPGWSEDEILRGVEGHATVIGDKFNKIESCTHEARKAGVLLHLVHPPSLIAQPAPAETVALIIGGASCWQDDLIRAKELIGDRPVKYYFINDQIKTFPEPGIACTLHPDKLTGQFNWLGKRRQNGLPEPEQVWAHRRFSAVTNDTASKDWTGSSGLFATMVARRAGHQRIIACGVPMTVEGMHFERNAKWQSAVSFRTGWLKTKAEIKDCFRSMSGWTKETFGEPDEAFLEPPEPDQPR